MHVSSSSREGHDRTGDRRGEGGFRSRSREKYLDMELAYVARNSLKLGDDVGDHTVRITIIQWI
jgi:hypothetical protein